MGGLLVVAEKRAARGDDTSVAVSVEPPNTSASVVSL